MNPLPHSLVATVQSIEQDVVRLQLKSGEYISWPKQKIANVQVGETVELVALSKHDVESERAAIAKQVLTYLLAGDDHAL